MRRFADYDPFAWLYHRYWGHEFHEQAMPALEKLILRRLPRRAAILDVCCGDGRIARELTRRGYRVTGLDGSEQMLSYARQRAPKAELLLLDARSFQMPARFDAAISTFDSLNHVLKVSDLAAVFRNVFASLKPGGCFAFDLNREEAYHDLWSRTWSTIDDDVVTVGKGSYDPQRRLAHYRVTLFRLERGHWHRSDFRLRQRYHRQEDVLAALDRAGFEVQIHDAAADLGMQGEIGQGRTFYLARASTLSPA